MDVLAPTDRQGFEIALVCALPVEADFVLAVFDRFWDEDNIDYGKAAGDPNAYTTGLVAGHNVVLAHMPGMGKVSAANVASTLRISFPRIRLAIVVGICGGVPLNVERDEEIVLGDVIISQALIQYDFGRQYPEAFAPKDTIEDSLGRPPPEIRSVLAKLQTSRDRQKLEDELVTYLEAMQSRLPTTRYPGVGYDKLYESSYIHRHRDARSPQACRVCTDDNVCEAARTKACDEVGCDESRLVSRTRLADIEYRGHKPTPYVHFGRIGSGDKVIKSGTLRDHMARNDGIIAFEMEGAGLWDHFPSIIVKGVTDYSDSHKNKVWRQYSAATAACCVKALLKQWTPEDRQTESAQRQRGRPLNQIPVTPVEPAKQWRDPQVTSRATVPEFIWHVPFDHMQNFVGREQAIHTLKTKLFNPTRGQKIAVFGLGGVGKSRIAWEMANCARSLGQYSVFWVQATSESSLERDYLEIGQKLRIPGLTDKGSDIKGLVKQHLSTEAAGKWLMILDNADDESVWNPRPKQKEDEMHLADYIPRSRTGSILITTRSRRVAVRLAGISVIRLQQVNPSEAVDILKGALIDEDSLGDVEDVEMADDAASGAPDSMRTLVERLQYLPLAIIQAAAYINMNGMSIDDYLGLLDTNNEEHVIDLLSENFEDDTRYRHTQNSIASTWLISFKQIRENEPRAIDLLSYITCLQEKDIPQSLLPEASSKKELWDIIGVLTGYSFIKKQSQERLQQPLYEIHRLVRLATRNWLRDQMTLQRWTEIAVKRVSELFPNNSHQNRETWKLYMPHAQALCDASTELDVKERYNLLDAVGHCLLADGIYKEAIDDFFAIVAWHAKQSAELNGAKLGADVNLGLALEAGGAWIESEKYISRALEGQTKLYGLEHAVTLSTMTVLARIYEKLGRWKEAEDLGDKVISIKKNKFGNEHKETLLSLSVQAEIYLRQGRWSEAERLGSQVMEVNEKLLGHEHPDTVASMNLMAEVYGRLHQWERAEQLAAEVLRLKEAMVGPDHPDTLASLGGLARTYLEQGRLSEAEAIWIKVTQATERIRGPEDPDTLSSMYNLASTYWEQGRFAEAEELTAKCFNTSKKILGADHPYTLLFMTHLARTWKRQGHFQSAYDLLSQCVELCTRKLGRDHPSTRNRRKILNGWSSLRSENGSTSASTPAIG